MSCSQKTDLAAPVTNGAGVLALGPLRLPSAAWTRILTLFFALAVIKLMLLLRLSRHLFEIHWRVADLELTGAGQAAFYLFVCLGVLSLVLLANRCRSVGVRAVRSANAAVVSLGLLFVFLSFHTNVAGSNNYLYPILTGVLKWSSLGSYLSLDLFFQKPLLGAWIFGYALAYYVLARTGRESSMLHVTAVLAGIYALLYLQELALCRDGLLLADCLGVVSVFVLWWPGRKSGFVWLLVPCAWSSSFGGVMFLHTPPNLGPSLGYFLGFLGVSLVLFSVATFLAHRRGFLGAWGGPAVFYFAAFTLLANSHYPRALNYNRLLSLGLEFPHYFTGEVALAALLAVSVGICFRIWPNLRLWWLDVLSLAFIVVAFVDFRLSQVMGLRLDWDLLALGNSPKMMWRMGQAYLPGAIAAAVILGVAYVLALRGLERWRRRTLATISAGSPDDNPVEGCKLQVAGLLRGPKATCNLQPGTFNYSTGLWYAIATFILLGWLGVLLVDPDKAEGQAAVRLAQTSPLWKRMVNRTLGREEFLRAANDLGLGSLEAEHTIFPAASRRDLNVLLVFMESSYNQHLSLFGATEETQPLLSKYKDRMEIFPNFFSNFASSIHARFAAFTGLYPVRDFHAFTLERVPVKSLFEVLHDHGYSCSLFYSSFADFTGFRDFLKGRGLDELYDADTMPGRRTTEPVAWGLREEETLGAIRGQITKYASEGRRFFLTYVPAAPHYPYERVPDAFRKFKMTDPDDFTPLYRNELLYMDWVLASIVDQLKASDLLDKTLVVITDDHGEMLGAAKGPIGHGWLLTPELANAPLIIMDPQNAGCRINPTVGSQVDLLPTLLDLLRIPIPAGQLYQGRSLYGPASEASRLVYLNSYQQYGILAGDRFLLGDREREQGRAAGLMDRWIDGFLGDRGTKKGGVMGEKRTIYSISNQGSKTVFKEAQPEGLPRVSIRQFDEFQESLLRNYSHYCDLVRKNKGLASH
jgi:hypothetical protein